MDVKGERVQKYLAALGVGSRRAVEQWIREGRLTANNKKIQLGDRVSAGVAIHLDGRLLSKPKQPQKVAQKATKVILYNKPEGLICSRDDPQGRENVFKDLPKLKGERWISVGRLDLNTRGLLLFTNDGDLANLLMHPRAEIEREYLCRVFGNVNKQKLDELRQGVILKGDEIKFEKVNSVAHKSTADSKNKWFSVVIKQGKYREVRRLWSAVDCEVNRLLRVRYGKISLPRGLKLGGWIELTPQQIDKLRKNHPNSETVVPKIKKNQKKRL